VNPQAWYETKDVCKLLLVSKATLMRRKREGYFKQGIHYRSTGPFARSTIHWNFEECSKVLRNWDAPEEGSVDG